MRFSSSLRQNILKARKFIGTLRRKVAEKLPRLYKASEREKERSCRKMIYVVLRNLTLPDNQLLFFSFVGEELFFRLCFAKTEEDEKKSLRKVFSVKLIVWFSFLFESKTFSWAMKNVPICLFHLNLFWKKFINISSRHPGEVTSYLVSRRREWKIKKRTESRPIKVTNTFFMFSNAFLLLSSNNFMSVEI